MTTTTRAAGPRWPLLGFLREVYAPGLHLAYAAAWYLALEGTLSGLAGLPWRPDARSLACIATFFLVLFFLRVADEWKDLAYDRVHNPDRPLVRGLVTLRDLYRYLWVAALLVLAINSLLAPWPLFIVLADLGWGLALVALERRSAALRDGMLLNLLLTYPVNVALSVHAYAAFLAKTGAAPSARGVLVIAAFALAFLVYELLRKTAWPALARPGERLYSQVLGGGGAMALVLACALGASFTLFALWLQQGMAPALASLTLLPLLPAGRAAWRFLRERRQRVKLTGLGMQSLLLFYGGLCLLALWRALA
ncbi:MAG TPA: hypothetical protein VLA61_10435 [Ideonella sp.]|uniref:hypothetical protein n=1 Tax=Ideonella sp. TaxID=1929293 RepID=UPI002BC637CE|nr:hypothetical protein [Ideonella sp.]HSI48678.1 hypothetical protein [Ideonella sp.]